MPERRSYPRDRTPSGRPLAPILLLLAGGVLARAGTGQDPADARKDGPPEIAAVADALLVPGAGDDAVRAASAHPALDLFAAAVEILHRALGRDAAADADVAPDLQALDRLAAGVPKRPKSAAAIAALAAAWRESTGDARKAEAALAARAAWLVRSAGGDEAARTSALRAFREADEAARRAPDTSPAAALWFRHGARLLAASREDAGAAAAGDEARRRARGLGWRRLECEALRAEGIRAFGRGDVPGLLAAAGAQFAVLEGEPDPAAAGHAFVQRGIARRRSGRLAGALEDQRAAVAAFDAIPDAVNAAKALQNLGAVAVELGRFPAALEAMERGLGIARAEGDPETVLSLRSFVAQIRGRIRSAPEHLAELESVRREAEERGLLRIVAETLVRLGEAAGNLGDHARAAACLEEVRDRRRADLPAAFRPVLFFELGSAYARARDVAKALPALEAAVAAAEAQGDRSHLFHATVLLGQVCLQARRRDAATDRFGRALTLAGAQPGLLQDAEVHAALAQLAVSLGRLDEATAILEDTVTRAAAEGDDAFAGQAAVTLAAVCFERGDRARARTLFALAAEHLDRAGRRTEAATALGNLGSAEALDGDHDAARPRLESAIARLEPHGDDRILAIACLRLAEMEAAAGRPAAAIGFCERSIALDQDLAAGLDEELASVAIERAGEAAALAFACAARRGPAGKEEGAFHEELLRFSETGRGLGLAALLARREEIRRAVLPGGHLDSLQRARERVALAQREYDAARHARPAPPEEEIRARWRQVDAADLERREAAARIAREHRRAAQVSFPAPAALGELRESLDGTTAWITYQRAGGRLYAFVVRKDGAGLVDLGSAAEILASARRARTVLATAGGDDRPLCRELGARLVRPLLGSLEGATRLLVCPEGELAFLPFDALLVGGEDGAEGAAARLLERFETSFCPSATAFVLLREDARARPAAAGFLGLCDPEYPAGDASSWRRLPATALEVEAAAAHFEPERRRVLARGSATLEGLRAAAEADAPLRLVHLACHGHWDPGRLSRPGLVLAGGKVAVADDLALLGLRSELTVLSACGSGLGRIQEGEGVMGLARAWFFAGSLRVVTTGWDVADEAARSLVSDCVRRLVKDSVPSAAALRAARLACLRSGGPGAHPSVWAAFTHWGLP